MTAEEVKKAQGMDITAFGDSVILDAAAGLQEIFPKMIVDGEVGRQLYTSTPLIQKLDKDKLLKNNVLVGLGTNGSFTEAQFDEFMAAPIQNVMFIGSMYAYQHEDGKTKSMTC